MSSSISGQRTPNPVMPEQSQPVTIVEVGFEGGGMTVSGRKRSDGTWELRTSTTSMGLDSNDNEQWIESTRPVSSLAEAFEGTRAWFGALVPGGSVHPEFRDAMRALVEQLAPSPGGPAYRLWEHMNREGWRLACASPASESQGSSD